MPDYAGANSTVSKVLQTGSKESARAKEARRLAEIRQAIHTEFYNNIPRSTNQPIAIHTFEQGKQYLQQLRQQTQHWKAAHKADQGQFDKDHGFPRHPRVSKDHTSAALQAEQGRPPTGRVFGRDTGGEASIGLALSRGNFANYRDPWP